MKTSNILLKFIAVLYLFVLSIGTVFAQADKQYGTRISDSKTGPTLKENVILELDSKEKGFMLPRMTTAQRDRLVKSKTADNGLAIYNVDIDCVEFWSERTEKWMSVCGSLPPAKLDLIAGNCAGIVFSGINYDNKPEHKDIWQQGQPLDPVKHMMKVTVKVDAIGTYQISASTDNGYFFSAEGQFQAVGTYDIMLKGMGTPTNGYDQAAAGGKKGDVFKFNFNGIESKACTNVELKVERAELDFSIKPAPSNTYNAEGVYTVKKPATLRDGHKISVNVTVNSPGRISITATSNSILGMKFTGGMNTTANGDYTVLLEPVDGENMAKVNIDATYDLTFSTNAKNQTSSINAQKASIVIKETTIEPLGTKATFGTTKYYGGEALTVNHTISLPVKVIAAGTTTLRLKDTTGNYEFVADNVVLDNPAQAGDEQIVVFKAKSLIALPKTTTPMELTLSGDQTRFVMSGTTKKVTLPIEIKPVAYTIKCDQIKPNRATVIVNKPIGRTYFIEVPVNVTVKGEYELYTETAAEGILFSSTVNGKKQEFSGTGDQIITLYALEEGKIPPNKSITVSNIKSNDANSTVSSCTPSISIKVGNVNLDILYAAYNNEMAAVERYFKLGDRFGETGKIVETGLVTVDKVPIAIPYDNAEFNNAANTAKRKAFADQIRSGKYNLIILDNTYSLYGGLDQQITDALDYYVKNFKGYVIIPSEQGGNTTDFAAYLAARTYGNGGSRTQVYDWIGKLNGTKMIQSGSNSTNDDNIGFIVPNSRFTFSTHYVQPTGYGLYRFKKDVKINTNGGNFTPILKTRLTDTGDVGSAFIHKTYNVIFLPMLDTTQDREFLEDYYFDALKQYDMQIPMPVHNNQKRAWTTFQGNLLVGIITAIMNQ